jgi:penicillin-binding protein 2
MSAFGLKDYFRESRLFQSRVSVAGVVVLVLTALLVVRLIYIQVINHSYYATLSQENRINPVPIQPPRGLILDRNGVVLAQNFPVFTLEVVPDQVDDMDALLAELGKLVTLNTRDLKNFKKQLRERPAYESLILRTRLSEEEAARVATHRLRYNGVELKAQLQRYYPFGGLAVHAIGYVGRINQQESERIDKAAYRGMTHIGKLGIEQNYENVMLGRVGFEQVENDAHGRAIRVLDRIAPHAGQNLYLNLDAKMQAIAEQGLGSRKGAVIAIDPQTGAVLTFASTPTYDPNLFVNGIDSDTYSALRDSRARPLINRVLNGRYSPGSTIKPFMALAALEEGGLDPNRIQVCPGWYSLPGDTHRFRCWKKEGHGGVNLHDAIVGSCDVYFYKLAVAMGIDRLKTFLDYLGLSDKTGVDLEGESVGSVPSPEARKARNQPWYPGETVVTGIGQGPILVTPLQLVDATSAVANGGLRVKPRLLRGIEDPVTKVVHYLDPEKGAPIPIHDQRHWATIIQDMTDVVNSPRGTAYNIGHNAPYKIAGKTGTAQVKSIGQHETYREHSTPEEYRDHALFIAFAPVENPKIAVAVIVENGGHGGSAAAPIARALMDYYLLGPDQGTSATAPAAVPAAATAGQNGD